MEIPPPPAIGFVNERCWERLRVLLEKTCGRLLDMKFVQDDNETLSSSANGIVATTADVEEGRALRRDDSTALLVGVDTNV